MTALSELEAAIGEVRTAFDVGRVAELGGGAVEISGLSASARLGDRVSILAKEGAVAGEVIAIGSKRLKLMLEDSAASVRLGDMARLDGPASLRPSPRWLGRVIDPLGHPLDGRPLLPGTQHVPLAAPPPPPAQREGLGERLETGMSVFNTFLPIVRGQRLGMFAGSGVGKSSLLAALARNMQADVVVIGLIGERGRELTEFTHKVLGPEGMARSVVVAATSDQSALMRRRAAPAAMAVAEYFRDQGKNVLLLADSVTRFAEAHREVALVAGEPPALKGYPPSLSHAIMSLCERAGPGVAGSGAITAVLSVLVAGSDMEEPVADILRGVLDGHVVMDRAIAERGRFPAIDLLRSVSRSLPDAASDDENKLIGEGRRLLGAYERSAMMIRAGLYSAGSDPELDRAIALHNDLDNFVSRPEPRDTKASFNELKRILNSARQARPAKPRGR